MTVATAHQQFKIGVDKTDVLNSANLAPEEIDLYISDAQEEFIEQRAYGNNFKRTSVEETQQRVKDLQDITINANLTGFLNNPDNMTNGTFVALPDGITVIDSITGQPYPEYRHAIHESAIIQYLDCNSRNIQVETPVHALTHDEYNDIIYNPFAQPNLDRVFRLPYKRINGVQYHEIVVNSGFTLISYRLRYIANPRKFNLAQIIIPPALIPYGLSANQEGDLPDTAYREIIRIAVRNALGDIQSPGTQDAMEKMKEME